jgi:hypothetical protein
MWAHFTALANDAESLFGPVRAGGTSDFRSLIMYRVEDEKFADIKVAYNSFVFTDPDGRGDRPRHPALS